MKGDGGDAFGEGMAEIYDSLELDLVRIASNRFEGTGSIPLAENEGDVWLKGPQRR